MCRTNYISALFSSIPSSSQGNKVQVSMKRSDGELFNATLLMLTSNEADKVKRLFTYLEELRTCACTRNKACKIHNGLEEENNENS